MEQITQFFFQSGSPTLRKELIDQIRLNFAGHYCKNSSICPQLQNFQGG